MRSLVICGFIGVAAASLSPAKAAVIGVTDADTPVPYGSTASFDLDGTNAFAIRNDYSFAKFDYFRTAYFNKSVSVATSGSLRIGSSVVAAGTSIDAAQSFTNTRLEAETAAFTSVYVGTQSYSCGAFHGSTCYRSIYGDVGHYISSNAAIGDPLYLPASYVDAAGVLEFGYISLAIGYTGPNAPYRVSLNGYAFQTDGSAIRAGEALTSLTPVPLPAAGSLMAGAILLLVGCGLARQARRGATCAESPSA